MWPSVTITVPAYNAERSIRATLESLLELDYPRDRLQILVLSDASTDGTDAIVDELRDRGVELHRQHARRGKTAAENAASALARGEIVVNVDAAIRIPPASLKALVRAFGDPSVGVASGRDVSTAPDATSHAGEAGYVGYEMRVRALETRAGSIVGASGCFFGVRRIVHSRPLPEALSWDFASALVARERGYRSVSVDDATCIVPRTTSLHRELHRKVRTMARGLDTLWYLRRLMNPGRYGLFAFMLVSHKLCRWLPYPMLPLAIAALVAWSIGSPLAAGVLAFLAAGLLLGVLSLRSSSRSRSARLLAVPGFAVASVAAGLLAWIEVIREERLAVWEPTHRPGAEVHG